MSKSFNLKINSKSTGFIEDFKKQSNQSKDKKIYVGILKKDTKRNSSEKKSIEPNNAQIGYWNEFGTVTDTGKVHIPSRSFIRSTLFEKKTAYSRAIEKISISILNRKDTILNGMKKLGEVAKRDIRKKIRDIVQPKNAPSTIKAKGSDKPLIDTGQLRNSIEYTIATRGEIDR